MNKVEILLLHVTTFLLTATGLIYAYMHYLLKPVDPFSVVNHPWEPHMMAIHIVVAPLLVLAVGLIAHSHVAAKLENGARNGRRSGILMIPLFAVMVVSGYLLQVITSDFRKALVWIHAGSGTLWFLSYLSHQVACYLFRRVVPGPNGTRNGRKLAEPA